MGAPCRLLLSKWYPDGRDKIAVDSSTVVVRLGKWLNGATVKILVDDIRVRVLESPEESFILRNLS